MRQVGSFRLATVFSVLLCVAGPALADDDTAPEPGEFPSQIGRIASPLHPQEEAIQDLKTQLQAIWSGANLRRGTTAIYVVDADSGEELYSVHEGEALNPASNVKLISTGSVLATLGPDWRYRTRVLGAEPDGDGTVHGGLYIYGNYDPTLGPGALVGLAQSLYESGVRNINGDIVLADNARDALAASRVRVTVRGAAPGKAPEVEVWPATGMVQILSKVRSRRRGRSRVRMQRRLEEIEGQAPVMHLELRGNIRSGHKRVLTAKVPRRSSFTASVLKRALEDAGIAVHGDTRLASFDEFNAQASREGRIPWPLAVHESPTIASLVARVNKRSLNHLADRLVMSAARSIHGGAPNMGQAVTLMKKWLVSIGVDANDIVLDTGSGLSYRTRLTTRQIVRVLRAAGGYDNPDEQTPSMKTFRDSLAIGGIDGTLRRRFRKGDVELHSHMHGKTGTLRSVIALSGFLAREDGGTICFSIVTNGHRNHRKRTVRLEHEHLVARLDTFLDKPEAGPAALSRIASHAPKAPVLSATDASEVMESRLSKAECAAPAGTITQSAAPVVLPSAATLRLAPLP